MASTTALFTGLSGLTASARNLDVIGNNIANVNTTGFKSNRMLFSSMFSRTLSIGSPPAETTGGTNPSQVGLGVGIAGTQRDFTDGAVSATGDMRDMAIEGDGFFVVNRDGQDFYTRAGAFRPNQSNQLVSVSGERLRGFAVDEEFNVIEGALVDMTVPVGSMTLAQATRNVNFAGNLNASGALPTQGSRIVFEPLALLGGGPIALGAQLAQIADPAAPTTPLFPPGTTLQINGADKGTKRLPTADLPITAEATVQDLIDFLNGALGIDTGVGANPDGRAPGVSLDPATGVLTVNGNTGSINDLNIDPSDLRLLDGAGNFIRQPMVPTKQAASDGESVRTSFVVYDSLGTPLTVDISMVLEGRSDVGTQWRYFVESGDHTEGQLQVGSGLLQFDPFGQLTGPATVNVNVDRAGTGAANPLAVALRFASDGDRLTALTDLRSNIASTFQDGAPLGTLSGFSVGPDGIITGAFTNSLTRTIGQVALANFSNPGGLIDAGSNLFTPGPNSGAPVVTAPTQLGAGRIVGGALELSNVDLSQEFINMILASTGFSASSRVITTTDQLMQQLLVIGR